MFRLCHPFIVCNKLNADSRTAILFFLFGFIISNSFSFVNNQALSQFPKKPLIGDGLSSFEKREDTRSLLNYYAHISDKYYPPPCIQSESELYFMDGTISATQTFYNCLARVTEPMTIPVIYNGTRYNHLTVYSSIELINLLSVDAIAGTVTLEFNHRLIWRDDRFAMPLFWNRTDVALQELGIELTPFLANQSIGLFLPDVRFHDVTDLTYFVQTLRLNASNIFFWSRHTLITLTQTKLSFTSYPADSHMLRIRFGSYAYNMSWLQMAFASSPIRFSKDYDGSETFKQNPTWDYDSSLTSYTTYVSDDGFLNVIYFIGITRKGSGIVWRFLLPSTLLIFLGGLSFWADYTGRVDAAITLLLAVCACYIPILANVPLTSYLTNLDSYIIWMFLLLFFVAILHQIYASFQYRKDHWPLRVFFGHCVESIGRVTIFPIVTILFLTLISDIVYAIQLGLIIATAIVTSFVMVKEVLDLRHCYHKAIKLLLVKLNSSELLVKELSWTELFLINRLEFQTWSISAVYLSEYLEKTGGLEVPQTRSIPLRRYSKWKAGMSIQNFSEEKGRSPSKHGEGGGRDPTNGENENHFLESNHSPESVEASASSMDHRVVQSRPYTLSRFDSDDNYSVRSGIFFR